MPHRVTELHSIMPIDNVPSVMAHGLLSYEAAAALTHHSVAMPEIQDRRDKVQVPGGLKLHQYANLYFHARNPMMFKRRHQASGLCVLRVSREVFDLDNVVLADQNAASNYVRFLGPAQLWAINLDLVYARDWTSPDLIAYYRQKAAKCAEVLVPQRVPPELIVGAYVVSEAAGNLLKMTGFGLPITVDADLFFH
ncbi:hypothetical protein BSY238_1887 [Methyloversatilis sp. RAC08]|uniref:DUF4433 domain-containing protein n=1 Tax=Methyloversatilis sp. RAC08 TaxID=1842540 RepID=UPI00083DC639|nr:DUF4433 domain-containing protein [Methyloversatilis sp. RAC08]AOF81440.1 hypothetical protein BSY238_1887 [Methyloversatilis sp. RAC08]